MVPGNHTLKTLPISHFYVSSARYCWMILHGSMLTFAHNSPREVAMLRVALLVLVGLSAWAQDLEVFTLNDGRVLVGNYDPATKTLRVQSGGGVIAVMVEPGKIVSRKAHVPSTQPREPAPPLVVTPAPVAPPAPPPPAVVIPPPDPFKVSQLTIDMETATLKRLVEKAIAENKDEKEANRAYNQSVPKELNEFSGAMMKARRVTDPPVRFRCFVSIAEEYHPDLSVHARTNWLLNAYDENGKGIGILMIPRDSKDGQLTEAALAKADLAPFHGWLRPQGRGWFDVLRVDRVVTFGWGFE